MSRPMDTDRIRRALKPYLADLNFVRDDASGCVVAYLGDRESDQGWLKWFKLDRLITEELGGSWVQQSPRFYKAHWRIPRV
jgi:hypothetical protein